MKQNVLEKLEWTPLINQLASFCKTKAAIDRSLSLKPDLKRDDIEARWRLVDPLRQLVQGGYSPPLSELDDISSIFRGIAVGQILSGQELRQIYNLLMIVKSVHKFCNDFSNKCSTLKHFHARTYPLPRILSEIERTVDAAGDLLDDASPELSSIRSGKLALRKRIESVIKGLFQDSDIVKYLQDDFYTIRSERYVVPIKLDGRGRIKGSIYDTSDSGQTLFIEPTAIAPLNEQLLEFELSEKLEIIRIFRALGEKIAAELDIIRQNYTELVELDFLNGQAILAKTLKANPVRLSATPTLNLLQARHPLLAMSPDRSVVANSVELKTEQKALIISGPNAGGKTVVLKTVGLLHVMVKAGLLLPCDPESNVFLFDDIYLELGDAQNLSANLSTFSGHLMGIKPIIERARENDLVLMDEIAAGTEPQAGSALAQAILEHLVASRCTTVATTHFDALKAMAVSDQRYRNGSMEYSLSNLKPTYHLVLDVPGQSYGIELAEHIGLPQALIARAKDLRGSHANRLDEVINELNELRVRLGEDTKKYQAKTLELESAKAHWQAEKESLEEARRAAGQQMSERYDERLSELRDEYDQLVDEMRKKMRQLEERGKLSDEEKSEIQELRQGSKGALDKMRSSINELHTPSRVDAGPQIPFSELKENMRVYVRSLGQEGVVARVPASAQQPVDIRLGLMNVRVELSDLSLRADKATQAEKKRQLRTIEQDSGGDIPFTPQGEQNTLDVRGKDTLDALDAMWRFLDQALRRGEHRVVIIHGHGFNKLKPAMRAALQDNPPYKLRFRAGEEKEGGDGVTIVALS